MQQRTLDPDLEGLDLFFLEGRTQAKRVEAATLEPFAVAGVGEHVRPEFVIENDTRRNVVETGGAGEQRRIGEDGTGRNDGAGRKGTQVNGQDAFEQGRDGLLVAEALFLVAETTAERQRKPVGEGIAGIGK